MKVHPKHIRVLRDDFHAREGNHKLRITRMGHEVIVEASDGAVEWDSTQDFESLTLADVTTALLEWRLRNRRP